MLDRVDKAVTVGDLRSQSFWGGRERTEGREVCGQIRPRHCEVASDGKPQAQPQHVTASLGGGACREEMKASRGDRTAGQPPASRHWLPEFVPDALLNEWMMIIIR